jgi:hypothetical protein
VDNAQETVGQLREPFEALGYMVESLNYGYIPKVWEITKRNPMVAARLAERVLYWQVKGATVDIVGHSNGCAIGYIATEEYGMKVNVCVAINPALTADKNPSRHAKLVQVWHNEGDKAVVMGKWLSWFARWARDARPWGEQGKIGYQGKDKNVVNFDAGNDFKEKADGHSAVFHKPESEYFLREIAAYCSLKVKRVIE